MRVPVVINGDIVDPGLPRPRSQASGADGVMVGRGAYGAPWMPARIDATLASGRDPGSPPLARAGRDRAAARARPCWPSTARSTACASPASTSAGIWRAAAARRDAVAAWRRRLCTSENAGEVLDGLGSFYDEAFRAEAGEMAA